MTRPADDDEVTLTLTRAEAGIVRTLVGAHRGTLRRKMVAAERKGGDVLEVRREHNDRDTALTHSAYRKIKRALWGKPE